MWLEAIRAARELRPRAFIFENVKGLTRRAFAEYLDHIVLQLSNPSLCRSPDEDWIRHREHLLQHSTRQPNSLEYNVTFQVLDAADYGVPQRRHRVFFVGFRSDLNIDWSFPRPTHSRDALIWSKYVSGDYWDRHGISRDSSLRDPMHCKSKSALKRVRGLFPPQTEPWLTVRDALEDLPEPTINGATGSISSHRFQPGARSYPGHTGSPLDEPAKALKAGVHGVPGGENMMRRPDGTVRYFSVRESARLQTFPDDYTFRGAWGETMRQLGNAVPVLLGKVVADAVYARLSEQMQQNMGLGESTSSKNLMVAI